MPSLDEVSTPAGGELEAFPCRSPTVRGSTESENRGTEPPELRARRADEVLPFSEDARLDFVSDGSRVVVK